MSDCVVCGCKEQMASGMTAEVVLVWAVIHGMASALRPSGRPALCIAHERLLALILSAMSDKPSRPEGALC